MSLPSIVVAISWIDAANHQDFEALAKLSQPNIEFIGPRGTFTGVHTLRDWLVRAGLTISNKRAFAKNAIVVIDQRGVWRSNGEQSAAEFASRFVIVDNRVQQYERSDDLDKLLQQAGLSQADEVGL